ncbi:DUF4236 domain-containing protein [Actinoplanes subglobosus]|uniref:DUF4236 domain-containing protein n=1 Tax=Actinoplanes subglobosus TaxID=1547892 RepID=A0ABV8JA98_9ACTN
MSFYLRTSLRAGPFRFNLSASGVSVSAGVPGFRVGTGPRGNYVRVAGLGTTYFTGQQIQAGQHQPYTPQPAPVGAHPVVMQDLTGAAVQHLAAAHPSDLIQQIQAAAKSRSLWPWSAALLLLLVAILPVWGLLLLLPGIPAVWWLWQRDVARRSVVVFYTVEDDAAAQYGNLNNSAGIVAAVQRIWLVESQGQLTNPYQRKVNAGAGAVVGRHGGGVDLAGPPVLVTNIAVPTLHAKDRSIYFLPDRVLVRHGNDYADIPYAAISAHMEQQRFIEEQAPPTDAQTVGTTWRYVNKSGGPDRRFKDNRQLPIMLYGRITFTAPPGFLMVWDFSRPDVAYALASAVHNMR